MNPAAPTMSDSLFLGISLVAVPKSITCKQQMSACYTSEPFDDGLHLTLCEFHHSVAATLMSAVETSLEVSSRFSG